jgi:hypothetical protein
MYTPITHYLRKKFFTSHYSDAQKKHLLQMEQFLIHGYHGLAAGIAMNHYRIWFPKEYLAIYTEKHWKKQCKEYLQKFLGAHEKFTVMFKEMVERLSI